MPRHGYPLTIFLALIIVGVASVPTLWRVPGAPTLSAWQANGSTVSPAQAAPFIGDWTAAITLQMGPSTYAVSVEVEGGNVVADRDRRDVPTRDRVGHLTRRKEPLHEILQRLARARSFPVCWR